MDAIEKRFDKFVGRNYTSFIVCSKSKILQFANTFGSSDVNLNIHLGKSVISINVNTLEYKANLKYKPIIIMDDDIFVICVNTMISRFYMFLCFNDINKKLNSIIVTFKASNTNNFHFISMYAINIKGKYTSDFGSFINDKMLNCVVKPTFKYRVMELVFGKIDNDDEYNIIRKTFRCDSPDLSSSMLKENFVYAFNCEYIRKNWNEMFDMFKKYGKQNNSILKDNVFKCMKDYEAESIGLDVDISFANTYNEFKEYNNSKAAKHNTSKKKRYNNNNKLNRTVKAKRK